MESAQRPLDLSSLTREQLLEAARFEILAHCGRAESKAADQFAAQVVQSVLMPADDGLQVFAELATTPPESRKLTLIHSKPRGS